MARRTGAAALLLAALLVAAVAVAAAETTDAAAAAATTAAGTARRAGAGEASARRRFFSDSKSSGPSLLDKAKSGFNALKEKASAGLQKIKTKAKAKLATLKTKATTFVDKITGKSGTGNSLFDKVKAHTKTLLNKVFGGAISGVLDPAKQKLFDNPPPPDEEEPEPAFVAPAKMPPFEWTDESRLMLDRAMDCFRRKDAAATSRTIRPELLDYRGEVLKTIPGLTDALLEGVKLQLTRSEENTRQLVQMYEMRRRALKTNGEDADDSPGLDYPPHNYEASPDMLGDVMWSHWCPASRRCTRDERCLITTLVLLNVLGADGRNAEPTVDGEQIGPDATKVGPHIGQLDDPNAPNKYYPLPEELGGEAAPAQPAAGDQGNDAPANTGGNDAAPAKQLSPAAPSNNVVKTMLAKAKLPTGGGGGVLGAVKSKFGLA